MQRYGSDVIVDLMKAYGIEYAAFNPGATFRGIHDSLVNYGGNQHPETIECCHEEISVAIAHGYAKATGRPMAAITHNVVGLMHATMAIYNAWCDRVPMLVLGGTGPMDTSRRRAWIDWIHTAQVQGNLVRDFVKWDDQPASLAAVPESFARGYRLATTPPEGPVYLCYDALLQEEPLEVAPPLPDLSRTAAPERPGAAPASLRRLVELLATSRRPLLLADRLGGSEAGARALLRLAERLSAPVVDGRARFNFPTTHPLFASDVADVLVAEADLVLALDTVDLFGALGATDRYTREVRSVAGPRTTVVQVSLEQYLTRSWTADYMALPPVDLSLAADPGVVVEQLLEVLPPDAGDVAEDRRRWAQQAAERQAAVRARWREQIARQSDEKPVSPAVLAAEAWEVLREEDWVVANGTLAGWVPRLWEVTRPGQILGRSGGAGLGYGAGAAIGAALAHRGSGRLCIDFQADGDFLMTPSALWTIAHHRLPLLIVMHNNQSFYNSEEHADRMAVIRNRPRETRGVGIRLDDPAVDYAGLARSFGLHGEGPVRRPSEVRPALTRALRQIRETGTAALVDVVTQPR